MMMRKGGSFSAGDRATTSKTNQQCRVKLLDGTDYALDVPKKAVGQLVFDQVLRRLEILERDYFGLLYEDEQKVEQWLDLLKPVKKQIKKLPYRLEFRVRYYPLDPLTPHSSSRNHFYQQLRLDIVEGRLRCPEGDVPVVISYILQADLGDFESRERDTEFIEQERLLISITKEMQEAICEHHQSHRGINPHGAVKRFLRKIREVDGYGARFFGAKYDEFSCKLAVSPFGVSLFKRNRRAFAYDWADVETVSFKSKKFVLNLDGSGKGGLKHVAFDLESLKACKELYRVSVDFASFYSNPQHRTREDNESSSGTVSPTPPPTAEGSRSPLHHPPPLTSSQAEKIRKAQSLPRKLPSDEAELLMLEQPSRDPPHGGTLSDPTSPTGDVQGFTGHTGFTGNTGFAVSVHSGDVTNGFHSSTSGVVEHVRSSGEAHMMSHDQQWQSHDLQQQSHDRKLEGDSTPHLSTNSKSTVGESSQDFALGNDEIMDGSLLDLADALGGSSSTSLEQQNGGREGAALKQASLSSLSRSPASSERLTTAAGYHHPSTTLPPSHPHRGDPYNHPSTSLPPSHPHRGESYHPRAKPHHRNVVIMPPQQQQQQQQQQQRHEGVSSVRSAGNKFHTSPRLSSSPATTGGGGGRHKKQNRSLVRNWVQEQQLRSYTEEGVHRPDRSDHSPSSSSSSASPDHQQRPPHARSNTSPSPLTVQRGGAGGGGGGGGGQPRPHGVESSSQSTKSESSTGSLPRNFDTHGLAATARQGSSPRHGRRSHDSHMTGGHRSHDYKRGENEAEFPLPNSPAPPPYKSPSPESEQAQVLQRISQVKQRLHQQTGSHDQTDASHDQSARSHDRNLPIGVKTFQGPDLSSVNDIIVSLQADSNSTGVSRSHSTKKSSGSTPTHQPIHDNSPRTSHRYPFRTKTPDLLSEIEKEMTEIPPPTKPTNQDTAAAVATPSGGTTVDIKARRDPQHSDVDEAAEPVLQTGFSEQQKEFLASINPADFAKGDLEIDPRNIIDAPSPIYDRLDNVTSTTEYSEVHTALSNTRNQWAGPVESHDQRSGSHDLQQYPPAIFTTTPSDSGSSLVPPLMTSLPSDDLKDILQEVMAAENLPPPPAHLVALSQELEVQHRVGSSTHQSSISPPPLPPGPSTSSSSYSSGRNSPDKQQQIRHQQQQQRHIRQQQWNGKQKAAAFEAEKDSSLITEQQQQQQQQQQQRQKERRREPEKPSVARDNVSQRYPPEIASFMARVKHRSTDDGSSSQASPQPSAKEMGHMRESSSRNTSQRDPSQHLLQHHPGQTRPAEVGGATGGRGLPSLAEGVDGPASSAVSEDVPRTGSSSRSSDSPRLNRIEVSESVISKPHSPELQTVVITSPSPSHPPPPPPHYSSARSSSSKSASPLHDANTVSSTTQQQQQQLQREQTAADSSSPSPAYDTPRSVLEQQQRLNREIQQVGRTGRFTTASETSRQAYLVQGRQQQQQQQYHQQQQRRKQPPDFAQSWDYTQYREYHQRSAAGTHESLQKRSQTVSDRSTAPMHMKSVSLPRGQPMDYTQYQLESSSRSSTPTSPHAHSDLGYPTGGGRGGGGRENLSPVEQTSLRPLPSPTHQRPGPQMAAAHRVVQGVQQQQQPVAGHYRSDVRRAQTFSSGTGRPAHIGSGLQYNPNRHSMGEQDIGDDSIPNSPTYFMQNHPHRDEATPSPHTEALNRSFQEHLDTLNSAHKMGRKMRVLDWMQRTTDAWNQDSRYPMIRDPETHIPAVPYSRGAPLYEAPEHLEPEMKQLKPHQRMEREPQHQRMEREPQQQQQQQPSTKQQQDYDREYQLRRKDREHQMQLERDHHRRKSDHDNRGGGGGGGGGVRGGRYSDTDRPSTRDRLQTFPHMQSSSPRKRTAMQAPPLAATPQAAVMSQYPGAHQQQQQQQQQRSRTISAGGGSTHLRPDQQQQQRMAGSAGKPLRSPGHQPGKPSKDYFVLDV